MKALLIRAIAAVIISLASITAQAQYATLHTWYSESRGDHFTTTDARWAGDFGETRSPDYKLIRIEGLVLSPEYPQPPDTVPLYSFWNGSRQDNFLTSDSRWVGRASADGYTRIRLEGYIYDQPRANTAALYSLWSGSSRDNFSTTDPRLALGTGVSVGDTTSTTFRKAYNTYRVEGYMLPPPTSDDKKQPAHKANLNSIGFGKWRPLSPLERGVRPHDPIRRAEVVIRTKLIVMPVAFTDLQFSRSDLLRYLDFSIASSDLSIEKAVRQISRGKFSWELELSPIIDDKITFAQTLQLDNALLAFQRQPQTLRDGTVINWTPEYFEEQNGYDLSVYDLDGDGPEVDELNIRTRMVKLADDEIEFNKYDFNSDGRVDNSELVILRFGADPGNGGKMGGSGIYFADGKSVAVAVGLLAKDTTRAGLVHELLHIWGGIDVYGPGLRLNFRSTILAAFPGDDTFLDLDPWHQQKFGWVRPRFVPISTLSRRAGGLEIMTASGHDATGLNNARPIIFYDPNKGLDEYFVAQYRSMFPTCPDNGIGASGASCPNYLDNGVANTGFAVWHVRTTPSGGLQGIMKVNDVNDRIAWPVGTADDGQLSFLGTIDPADGKIGRSNFLLPIAGELPLRWWNGDDTNLRLSVGLTSTTSSLAVLKWRDATTPFTPRLDILRVDGFPHEEYPTVRNRQTVAVDGVFGTSSDGLNVKLKKADGDQIDVRIESWSPTRLLVEIPPNAPPGRYLLAVGTPVAPTGGPGTSNGLRLQIPTGVVDQQGALRDLGGIAGMGIGQTPPALPEGVDLDLSGNEMPGPRPTPRPAPQNPNYIEESNPPDVRPDTWNRRNSAASERDELLRRSLKKKDKNSKNAKKDSPKDQ